MTSIEWSTHQHHQVQVAGHLLPEYGLILVCFPSIGMQGRLRRQALQELVDVEPQHLPALHHAITIVDTDKTNPNCLCEGLQLNPCLRRL